MRRVARAVVLVIALAMPSAASAATVRVDATQLSTTAFRLDRVTPAANLGTFDGTQVQELDLAPSAYQFTVGSGLTVACQPSVTDAGTWSVPASCAGFIGGDGTDTLVLRGRDVTVDPTPLSTKVIFADAFGLRTNLEAFADPRTFRLMPVAAPYRFQPGSGIVASCSFTLGADGTVSYPAALEGCLSGAGTSTVTLNGVPVNIDARPLSTRAFVLTSVFTLCCPPAQSSEDVQHYRLLPLSVGAYAFQDASAVSPLTFNVDLAGAVSYATDFDAWVRGRGTDTLEVVGYPVEIDATATAPGAFRYDGLGFPLTDSSEVQPLRMTPVHYNYQSSQFPLFGFSVGAADGLLGAGLPECVYGTGTRRLTVGCRQLMVADTAVVEGDAGETEVVFDVALSGPVPADVTFDYATQDGTATAGEDYTARTGSVTIPAGETSATVIIPFADDSVHEDDETFTLTLSNPRNATILDGEGVATILDDDLDRPPLECSRIGTSPDTLWPPNHRMRDVALTGAPDGVLLTVTGVTQDEPVDDAGDARTAPDAAFGIDAFSVQLRAERSGLGDGRVYRIAFTADAPDGRSCTGTTTVAVPHDMEPGGTATDSGQTYDSTQGATN